LTIAQLSVLPEWNLSKNNKLLKSVEMIATFCDAQLQWLHSSFLKARIVLNFQDGTKQAFRLNAGDFNTVMEFNHACVNLYALLHDMHGKVQHAWGKHNLRVVNWSTTAWSGVCADLPPVEQFYTRLYPRMSLELVKEIKSDSVLLAKAKEKGCLVFSAGCGNGRDIRATINVLNKESLAIKNIIGIDICAENIKQCAQAYQDHEHARFFVAPLEEMEHHLPEVSAEQATQTPLQIVIFSGILTTGVISGTQAAAMALQTTHRAKALCVISGYEPSLITKQIAKAIGFEARLENFNKNGAGPVNMSNACCLYILKPMTAQRRAEYLQKRSHKYDPQLTTLDLSLSANPIEDLNLCLNGKNFENENIHSIDLSWALIKESEIVPFKEYLKRLPNLENIILHKSQKDLLATFKQSYKIIERDDQWGKDAVNAMTPAKFKMLCG
jgi:hypothetical protein